MLCYFRGLCYNFGRCYMEQLSINLTYIRHVAPHRELRDIDFSHLMLGSFQTRLENSSLEIVENGRNGRKLYIIHTIFVVTNVSNDINVSFYS